MRDAQNKPYKTRYKILLALYAAVPVATCVVLYYLFNGESMLMYVFGQILSCFIAPLYLAFLYYIFATMARLRLRFCAIICVLSIVLTNYAFYAIFDIQYLVWYRFYEVFFSMVLWHWPSVIISLAVMAGCLTIVYFPCKRSVQKR